MIRKRNSSTASSMEATNERELFTSMKMKVINAGRAKAAKFMSRYSEPLQRKSDNEGCMDNI